jgi:hypothetical protein
MLTVELWLLLHQISFICYITFSEAMAVVSAVPAAKLPSINQPNLFLAVALFCCRAKAVVCAVLVAKFTLSINHVCFVLAVALSAVELWLLSLLCLLQESDAAENQKANRGKANTYFNA